MAEGQSNVVVLTGGMGMGKSTIARIFLEKGFTHVDTDSYVHWLYSSPSPAFYAAMKGLIPYSATFDEDDGQDRIDRRMVARAVVDNPHLLEQVEAIVAPHLAEKMRNGLTTRSVFDDDRPLSYLLDSPLYFERAADDLRAVTEEVTQKSGGMLTTIAVVCEPQVQRERCMARPGMTAQKFDLLTSKQMPNDEKRKLADYVIDTSGDLSDTTAQVENILVALRLREFF